MNTDIKPQQVKRCTECKAVFQMAGDTPIGLIRGSIKVPNDGTKASEGKCPRHASKGGDE